MWPSAVVAVAIIALIGALGITAIDTYESVDDALKIFAALSGVIGVVTGAFVAYFFTKEQVVQATERADALQERSAVYEQAFAAMSGQVGSLGAMPRDNPIIERAMNYPRRT
jgi:ammonia channel protein AmtB